MRTPQRLRAAGNMRPLGRLKKNSRESFVLSAGSQGGVRMASIRLMKAMPDGSFRELPVGLYVKEDQIPDMIALLSQAIEFFAKHPSQAGGIDADR